MSGVTFNNQNLTTEATNYADSVDKLKQAAKPFMNEAGVINITRETTMEDDKKIENYTSQIHALFGGREKSAGYFGSKSDITEQIGEFIGM